MKIIKTSYYYLLGQYQSGVKGNIVMIFCNTISSTLNDTGRLPRRFAPRNDMLAVSSQTNTLVIRGRREGQMPLPYKEILQNCKK